MKPTIAELALPSIEDARIAKESSRRLAPLVDGNRPAVKVQIKTGSRGGHTVDLPASAFQLLLRILNEMSQGNAVTLMPIHAQLTTQQAAELLGVSRPFLVKELKKRRIRHQMVGTHRRIAYTDLVAYQQQCRIAHGRALDELVQQAQELKMGY
jgi:excisionase family DNA binding protein